MLQEIRSLLFKECPSLLHKVDSLLDDYANHERELYNTLRNEFTNSPSGRTRGSHYDPNSAAILRNVREWMSDSNHEALASNPLLYAPRDYSNENSQSDFLHSQRPDENYVDGRQHDYLAGSFGSDTDADQDKGSNPEFYNMLSTPFTAKVCRFCE
jgi:hypothetical protein